ncbi:MAG: hypothetical protein H0X64_10220 [Gemmatimonadaceae bacterium]|nr:hypothetical protein [Gemmatimonadaceae bacterium]
MPHLSAERLAALADAGTVPEAHEHDHLAHCSACASERDAYAALVLGARADRRAIATPLTNWDGIAAGLRADGILGAPASKGWGTSVVADGIRRPVRAGAGDAPHGRSFARSPWLTIAAAVVLMAGGVAAGRATAVTGPLAVAAPVPAAIVADARDSFGARAAWPAEDLVPEYRTAAEAEAALMRLEVAYQHAAAYLAGSDTLGRLDATEDYRTRLVALDRASRTMREAMEKAPYDPVLTGYYLTTLGQREATLRQLNVAVPAGARLNSF